MEQSAIGLDTRIKTMNKYSSKPTTVNKSPGYWYAFFTDMRNFKQLLPDDKISEWEADENSCRFQIKGLTKVSFSLKEKSPERLVVYTGSEKMPVPLNIVMEIEAAEGTENQSILSIHIETELNPMMKMMLDKPLTNLVNTIGTALPTIASKI